LRIKEQETCLNLHEREEDDNDKIVRSHNAKVWEESGEKVS
jgi:hypothetical protein